MSTATLHRSSVETSDTASGIRAVTGLLGRAFTLLLRAPAGF
jgi:hypothetical protein